MIEEINFLAEQLLIHLYFILFVLKHLLTYNNCTVSKTKKNEASTSYMTYFFDIEKTKQSYCSVIYYRLQHCNIDFHTNLFFSSSTVFLQNNTIMLVLIQLTFFRLQKYVVQKTDSLYQKQVFPPQSIMKLALHKLGILN